jgi:DHA1 family quinolone resistance protein-like MFS transporter
MNIRSLRFLATWNLSFHWFAVGLILPVLTLYMLEKGLSLTQIGLAGAMYSGVTVLLELPTGGLADTIGRKKIYITSLLFQIAAAAIMLHVRALSALMFAFAFQGISRSLSSGAMDAHFIDEFYRIDPKVNLQREMARIGTWIPVGLGIGSLLGGFIPMIIGFFTEASYLDSLYASNFLVFAGVLVIQLVTTAVFVREEPREGGNGSLLKGFAKLPEVVSVSMRFGIGHPVVLLLLLGTFAWGFSISSLEQLWQPQVKSIIDPSTGTWIFGFLTTGYFLAAALGNAMSTAICRLFGNRYSTVLFAARLAMGILYAVLALQSGIVLFTVFYFAMFMFNGVPASPESSLFNAAVPSHQRSTLLSFSSLFMQTGAILGQILLSFTADRLSIKIAWLIAAGIIAASSLLYLKIPATPPVHDGADGEL